MKKTALALVALICLTAAGPQKAKKNQNLEVAKQLDIFTQIYRNLHFMYVDTLNAPDIIGVGIEAMLANLDPYTEYYPETETKDLKQMITGKYAGIGALIRYHRKEKMSVIDEPYVGMPACEAGLRKGDIILAIDDSTMAGKMTDYVSSHLRGEAGTTFALRYRRPSTGREQTVRITRRTIKMPDIPYCGMLSPTTGYIALSAFTDGVAKEMRRAYIDLKRRGATSLILDLRGNGGGSLSEAVDIVNMWVPKGLTLVDTRGKLEEANHTYKTRLEPIDTLMPLTVIVNGETASAAEITCGSLQDLDRAVIIGTRTYGKGLVQIPIDLPYNTQMKLTTGKYYIPSGRCIQAIDYKHNRRVRGERIPDSLTHVFHTAAGRQVRDGGGIAPDIEIKPDTLPNIAIYLDHLDSTEVMFDWVTAYTAKHKKPDNPRDFRLTDSDYADFKAAVKAAGFTYDPVSKEAFKRLKDAAKFEGYYEGAKAEFDALESRLAHDLDRDLDREQTVIRQLLEDEILADTHHRAGAAEHAVALDKQVAKAAEILANPQQYNKIISNLQ